MVGSGPQRQELEQLTRDWGLGACVTFFGTLDRAQVAVRLAAATVYVHPSIKESFSFALLEAKFAGLRTVAHAELEVPTEFIDAPVTTWRESDWAFAVKQVLSAAASTFKSDQYDVHAFAYRLRKYL